MSQDFDNAGELGESTITKQDLLEIEQVKFDLQEKIIEVMNPKASMAQGLKHSMGSSGIRESQIRSHTESMFKALRSSSNAQLLDTRRDASGTFGGGDQ